MSMFVKLTTQSGSAVYVNRYLVREVAKHHGSTGAVLVYGPTEDDMTVIVESPEVAVANLGYDDPIEIKA